MARPTAVLIALCALTSLLASPALARTHVIAQKSSKATQGTVYLRSGLRSGHKYRIDVTAYGHQPFAGYGTAYFMGVLKGKIFTGTPPSLTLNGTTPHSFSVSQPYGASLREWILAVQITLKRGRNLTVRFVDLGSH